MNLCIKVNKGKHPGGEQFYRPCMNINVPPVLQVYNSEVNPIYDLPEGL